MNMRGGVGRRAFLRTVSTAGIGAASAACVGGQVRQSTSSVAVTFDQPIEVSFWHTQTAEKLAALEALVQRFNQTNGQRITVRAQYQGNYNQLNEKNPAPLTGGTPPDSSAA